MDRAMSNSLKAAGHEYHNSPALYEISADFMKHFPV
jgi:hypothetical protein